MSLRTRVFLYFSLATFAVALVVGLIRQSDLFDTLGTALICLAFPWLIFGVERLKARGW